MPFFLIFCLSIYSSFVSASDTPIQPLFGDWQQGGLVMFQVKPNTKVLIDQRAVPVSAQGEVLVGIGRDVTQLSIRLEQGQVVSSWQQPIQPSQYDVQRIDGLPDSKVTPDEKALAEIKKNNADVAKARNQQGLRQLPALPFQWPVSGRISGVYGSQRILNGQPRRPHFGVDIAAPEGTPIVAPADGVVILTDPKMVLTGQTMMLDHGLGLKSIYVHLSSIDVKVGDRVSKGDRIGAVGKTGRAAGPHLHWGVSWLDVQINPAKLTDTVKP